MHTTYSFVCGCTGSLWLQGFSLVATRGAPSLDAQAAHCDAPLLAEHGLQVHGLQSLGHMGSVAVAPGLVHWLNSYGTWVQLLCGMRDLKSEIEPMSSAGVFLTTEPPGKHFPIFFKKKEVWQVLKNKRTYME